MKPAWYACTTRSRSEKKAAERLRRRGIPTYLPLIPTERQWADRTKIVDRPVFPGYIFCRFAPDQLVPVLRTPGVARVVRHGSDSAVIRDDELENVRRVVRGLVETGRLPEPVMDFRVGEPVRVTGGPFRGVTGRVREVRGRNRLLVGLEEIGQGLEVDVSGDVLEAAPSEN